MFEILILHWWTQAIPEGEAKQGIPGISGLNRSAGRPYRGGRSRHKGTGLWEILPQYVIMHELSFCISRDFPSRAQLKAAEAFTTSILDVPAITPHIGGILAPGGTSECLTSTCTETVLALSICQFPTTISPQKSSPSRLCFLHIVSKA